MIIELTEAARDHIIKTADDNGIDPRVRIRCQGGGCSGMKVSIDFTQFNPDPEKDSVYDIDGVIVIVDEKSEPFLAGATLDYGGDSPLEKTFIWDLPGAAGGCGCGLSFEF